MSDEAERLAKKTLDEIAARRSSQSSAESSTLEKGRAALSPVRAYMAAVAAGLGQEHSGIAEEDWVDSRGFYVSKFELVAKSRTAFITFEFGPVVGHDTWFVFPRTERIAVAYPRNLRGEVSLSPSRLQEYLLPLAEAVTQFFSA